MFSSWGTVTPVRRQDDFGVDLYCTLTERKGHRAFVSEYFTVQVKSSHDAWHFPDPDSVSWLIDHPLPLFLAVVDKKAGILRVYHTLPRFDAAIMPPLPAELTLEPTTTHEGSYAGWTGKPHFSLSAPILEVTITDLLDSATMTARRSVFRSWVTIDRTNGELARQGLLRFRVPDRYRTNEDPSASILEMGHANPPSDYLERGIVATAEAAECIGGQLGRGGDRWTCFFAALLVDRLQKTYKEAFSAHLRWNGRLPADLGYLMRRWLDEKGARYAFEGFDAAVEGVTAIPALKKNLD